MKLSFFRSIVIAAILTLATLTTAVAQNNVLAQLGAEGVTDQIHGTNAALYAGFLVKLESTGQLHSSLFPAGAGDPIDLTEMIFIDATTGGDTNTYNGRISRPYKTFSYAVDQVSDDTIFIFMPGAYTAVSVTNMNNMVLMGFDADRTTMSGTLALAADEDFTVTVVNMSVATIRQQKYQHINVNLYDRAKISNQINRQNPYATNSILTLRRDPSITLANPIATSNSVEILTHNAIDMGYTAGDTNDWWEAVSGTTPIAIAGALDQLAGRLEDGASAGQLAYWNSTNWTPVTAGTTNQFLIGGAEPTWSDRLLWPGTNVGQMVYWDGTSWTHIIAGSSNTMLFGSSPGDAVPIFRTFGDVYDAYDVPYLAATSELVRIGGTTNGAPADVGAALDYLFTNAVPKGTALGQLAYWDGTNWSPVATGTVVQVLFGGSLPAWADITLVPDGASIGQTLEWNGTNWLAATRALLPDGTDTGDLLYWNSAAWVEIDKGAAVEVLFGGLDPQFRSPLWLGLGTNEVISTGTVDGQMMYWNTATNKWLHVPAGATNEVLKGGSVPHWVPATNFVMDTLNSVDVGFRWYATGTTNVLEFFSGTNKTTITFFD